MGRGTLLLLLVLIVLFALLGWKVIGVIGWIIVIVLVLLLLFFGALFLGAWLLKRRMARKLAQLQGAFTDAIRQAREGHERAAARTDAIDVEPSDVRDERQ